MCMLTYFPPMIQPDIDALVNGAICNDDGHGFSIVAGNHLITRHSMNADSLLDQFAELRAKHRRGPALFHSRFGTAGTRDRRNCHPFRIGGDRRTVLAHNGILPAIAQPSKNDKRCDTRLFAEDIARNQDIGSAKYRRAVGEWMGAYNKFVILTVNPRYKSRAYIINESSGNWDNGIWYSNWDYLPYTAPAPVAKNGKLDYEWYAGKESEITNGDCAICGSYGQIDVAQDMCLMCGSCTDCDMDRLSGNCICYRPDRLPCDEDEGAAAYLERHGDLTRTFAQLDTFDH